MSEVEGQHKIAAGVLHRALAPKRTVGQVAQEAGNLVDHIAEVEAIKKISFERECIVSSVPVDSHNLIVVVEEAAGNHHRVAVVGHCTVGEPAGTAQEAETHMEELQAEIRMQELHKEGLHKGQLVEEVAGIHTRLVLAEEGPDSHNRHAEGADKTLSPRNMIDRDLEEKRSDERIIVCLFVQVTYHVGTTVE